MSNNLTLLSIRVNGFGYIIFLWTLNLVCDLNHWIFIQQFAKFIGSNVVVWLAQMVGVNFPILPQFLQVYLNCLKKASVGKILFYYPLVFMRKIIQIFLRRLDLALNSHHQNLFSIYQDRPSFQIKPTSFILIVDWGQIPLCFPHKRVFVL